MKELASFFVHNLNIYDIILFITTLIVFLLMLILTVLARHKTLVAVLILITSIVFVIAAPVYGYIKINQRLYSHTCKITQAKKLVFSPALLVSGYIKNTSSHSFGQCKLILAISKKSKYHFINHLLTFSPFYTTILKKTNLTPNSKQKFQLIIQPFTYKGKYTLSLRAMCK